VGSNGKKVERMGCPRRIVIAGLAIMLCTGAYQDRDDRSSTMRRDGVEFSQRLRSWPDSDRRICAVDRLAESRLPRTTCRTAREWRDRQLHGMHRE
jgi:hypothetical protein